MTLDLRLRALRYSAAMYHVTTHIRRNSQYHENGNKHQVRHGS